MLHGINQSGFGCEGDCRVDGRSDNEANWEGRLDEIAIFDRALTAREVEKLTVK